MIKKKFYIGVHPGEVLQDILNESGISQVRLARHLKISQSKINEICRGKRGISPLMALRLARAFGQSAELWIGLQKEWELSQVTESDYDDVERIKLRA